MKKIPGVSIPMIKRTIKRVLKASGCDKKELSVLFTDDTYIAELNKRYRGKDKPTNVLAFPMDDDPSGVESGMLGDVVISVDTAIRESAESGEFLNDAINRLLIHGLVHLFGYDHERSREDERIMSKEEARYITLIGKEA
jgi:probable rRNA maturation factor